MSSLAAGIITIALISLVVVTIYVSKRILAHLDTLERQNERLIQQQDRLIALDEQLVYLNKRLVELSGGIEPPAGDEV